MSYLNPLRLHFAGTFQAAVSTVNNDPIHFDNATFEADYQERGLTMRDKGWWNPQGDSAWRLISCRVTSAYIPHIGAVKMSDAILSCIIADSDRKTAAKIIDLDPQQKAVSEIWGLEVRICDQQGETLVRGQFKPIAFIDVWQCCPSEQAPTPHSSLRAMYQSVLTDLQWGNLQGSLFLRELRRTSPRELSIKFNLDGYDASYSTPNFTLGRIVGTIGPAQEGEPQHFVAGRQLLPTAGSPLNCCVARLDEDQNTLYVDLGNALPTVAPGGPPKALGSLSFGYTSNNGKHYTSFARLAASTYIHPSWYTATAGVIELPLTPDELEVVRSSPIAIQCSSPGYALQEDESGTYVRADQFVYRLNPGEKARVKLYATTFGKPYQQARIISILDPSQLEPLAPGLLDQHVAPPPVAQPITAINFPSRVVTDEHGVAVLPIEARDPGNPRDYIDGQVYGVRPILEEWLIPGAQHTFNIYHFISLLVWDTFAPTDPPTWWGTNEKDSIQSIFQQYANLYPVMKQFLDLSEYDSVCQHRKLLLLAFGLDLGDPNSMPVARDLSTAKRQAIITWLSNLDAEGKPHRGTPPPVSAIPTAE